MYNLLKKGDLMSNYQILIPSKEITFKEAQIEASALITRTNKKGIITFASKGFRDMTLYTKKDLIGKPHNIVRHPFMPKAVFKEMWEIINQAKHWSGVIVNQRRDGKHYWVRVSIDAIDEEGNIISNMNTIGDYVNLNSTKKEIAGFVAIRREPTREEISKALDLYRKLKAVEGLESYYV
jgi:aerotaxis receptor